jgi:hypothetical protein
MSERNVSDGVRFGIDRSQPLPPVSDEALAREMREARARLLTEIDRRDFGIDREPPDRSGNAAG